MKRILFIAAFGVAACQTPRSQLMTIAPVTMPGAGAMALVPIPGVVKDLAAPEKTADTGNWFYRNVFQPVGSKRKLYAVEIIYCPTERAVFTECRVAVAWARDGKGGLGPQENIPPPSVDNEVGQPETAAAQTPSAAPRHTEVVDPPTESVFVGGKGFLTIPGGDIAKLRSWVKKTVLLSLSYGKTTTGQLKAVDASGLQLLRSSETVQYRWEELQTVAPQ